MAAVPTQFRFPRSAVRQLLAVPPETLWLRRELIRQLLARDVLQRYRGSYLGLLWSFLTPLALLTVYTVVFSGVFHLRWGGDDGSADPRDFALLIFAGLIPFNAVAECLARGPGVVVAVPSYVKKVVFPVEVLPVVTVGSALVQSVASAIVLLAVVLVFRHAVPFSVLLLPLAYVPLILLSLGLTWFLAALGVYARDVGQVTTAGIQVLVFASPVFYPSSAVPDWLRGVLILNPLTAIVEQFRAALLADQPFGWEAWLTWTVVNLAFAYLGFAWFMHSRKGFVDVL